MLQAVVVLQVDFGQIVCVCVRFLYVFEFDFWEQARYWSDCYVQAVVVFERQSIPYVVICFV